MLSSRQTRWHLALLLAFSTSLFGCRATGRLAFDAYEWSSEVFMPNPVSAIPYIIGFGTGFILGAPLSLITWPFTALTYPENEDHYFLSASMSPALFLATGLGTVLGTPAYPLGIPLMPEEPEPELAK